MAGPGAFLLGEDERRHAAEVMETGNLSRQGGEDDPEPKRKVVTLKRRLVMEPSIAWGRGFAEAAAAYGLS